VMTRAGGSIVTQPLAAKQGSPQSIRRLVGAEIPA